MENTLQSQFCLGNCCLLCRAEQLSCINPDRAHHPQMVAHGGATSASHHEPRAHQQGTTGTAEEGTDCKVSVSRPGPWSQGQAFVFWVPGVQQCPTEPS